MTSCTWNSSTVHEFTVDPSVKKINEAPLINNTLSPLTIPMFFFFLEVTKPLVVEANQNYHQCLDPLQDGPSLFSDVSESEMFLFLTIIIQMRHCI